ncbi:MAG: GUN4-like family protein, partial [bacterium]
IVVLSEAVLNKNWPQRELFAVLNLEASSGEVKILPLIVGERTILAKLPLLNDKAYLPWNNDPQPIVSALAKRLNIPNPL